MARQYDEVTFEIMEHYGVLNTTSNGWTKELNLVSWNGGEPKFDLRDWDATHERMTRGITLFKDDAEKLCEILNSVFNSEE